jgi:hypothetical protein
VITAEGVGERGDLAAAEEGGADAMVVLGVGEGVVSTTGAGEASDAFGEGDRPDPAADGVAVDAGGDRGAEVNQVALDVGDAAVTGRDEQGFEDLDGGVGGAGANVQAGEVDQGFEREAGGPGSVVGVVVVVLPAQMAGDTRPPSIRCCRLLTRARR